MLPGDPGQSFGPESHGLGCRLGRLQPDRFPLFIRENLPLGRGRALFGHSIGLQERLGERRLSNLTPLRKPVHLLGGFLL